MYILLFTLCKAHVFVNTFVESVENLHKIAVLMLKTVENSVENVENGFNKGFVLPAYKKTVIRTNSV